MSLTKRRTAPFFLREKGGSSIIFPLLLLLLLAAGYLGYKFVPPLLSHNQLRGAAQKIAGYSASGVLASTRYAAGPSQGPVEDATRAILAEARELRVPLERKNVEVTSQSGQLFIEVDYVIPVHLLGGVLYDLHLSFIETE